MHYYHRMTLLALLILAHIVVVGCESDSPTAPLHGELEAGIIGTFSPSLFGGDCTLQLAVVARGGTPPYQGIRWEAAWIQPSWPRTGWPDATDVTIWIPDDIQPATRRVQVAITDAASIAAVADVELVVDCGDDEEREVSG